MNLLDEGFQELDFLQEQEIFMTIKKMTENFELLNSNNFNVTIEEEKLRCKYLTLKSGIISYDVSRDNKKIIASRFNQK